VYQREGAVSGSEALRSKEGHVRLYACPLPVLRERKQAVSSGDSHISVLKYP